MQAGVDLLVTDTMPIYMIIHRDSHNYAQFYKLLDSNLFTTVILMLSWEKPLVKPMAPRSIFHHLIYRQQAISITVYFAFFNFSLYHKNTKNIILSYLSDLTLVSGRVGIDNPLSRWLRGFICLWRCEGLVRVLLLDWYLGSKKLREILTLLCCITLSSSRENQCMLKR